MSVANVDIRILMLKNEITQARLGELLDMKQPEVSILLRHEMSREQKRRIKEAIANAVNNS